MVVKAGQRIHVLRMIIGLIYIHNMIIGLSLTQVIVFILDVAVCLLNV